MENENLLYPPPDPPPDPEELARQIRRSVLDALGASSATPDILNAPLALFDAQSLAILNHDRGHDTDEVERRWASSLRVRGAIDSVLGSILSRYNDPESWTNPEPPQE